MATVAEVVARYRADTSAYVGPVRQAADATRQFAAAMPQAANATNNLKGSTIALGAAMGGVVAMGLAKATSMVTNFAKSGVQAAAEYEQTVISIEGIFQGMGMSAEEATSKTKSYLADLRTFAANTPFELPQTLDAVKRLLSIGYAAEDVKNRLLPAIGDIVAALGQPPQSISAVVYAFGQMKSAGRVLGQDLMQIGNALPGFNAKMALVNEMFGGDAVAAQKAFESGLVKSEDAINVLITAMQKFPGAAGAMTRQSKTLNGVISTFKDTVRNAMIDELMKAIPTLSGALENLVGPVKGVAEAFANALGPNLVLVAQEAQNFAPQLAELTSAVINLAGNGISNLIKTLGSLAPIISAQVKILGVIAQAFNVLPGPLQTVIALFVGLRVLMGSRIFGPMLTSLNSATIGVGRFAASLRTTQTAAVGGFGAIGAAAVGQMGLVARAGNLAVIGLNGVKAAVRSLWTSLGPVGIAIMGVSLAMELFTGRTQEADTTAKDFVETLKFVNGALDQNSRAMLYTQMSQDGTLKNLQALGISYADFFTALMNGGTELDALKNRLVEIEKAGTTFISTGRSAATSFSAEAQAAQAVSQTLGTYIPLLNTVATEQADAAAAAAETEAALKGAANGADMMTAGAARAAAHSYALQNAQEAAAAAVTALKDAFTALNQVISNEAARDSAIRSTRELTKALKDSEGGIKNNSDAALDNRAKIRDAANAWIAYAQATNDPVKQQQRLKQGQEEITKALKAAGLNPKDSKILDAFKEQQQKSDETVDKFKEQIPIASQYGIELGQKFIEGIIQSLENGKGQVSSAAASVGAAAESGAAGAMQINSPSRVAMRLGSGFIEGMVMSLNDGAAQVRSASGRAARSAAVGWQEVMKRWAPGLSAEWERALQDSVWAVEDAKDRILDAKKALEEARKDGTAREVAAAEREVARAYRDQADAIKAAAEAKRNYDALRKLAKMKPIGAGRIKITGASILEGSGIEDALQQARDLLVSRARKAGMSLEAANAYADAVMETFSRRIQVKQRRLNKLLKELEKVREQIDKLQQEQATRTEAGKTIAEFITDRFGEPSEFDKAYEATSVGIDQAMSLFDKFKELIKQRYTGLNSAEGDVMVKYLEDQTQKLIGLIKQRDDIKKRLDAAQRDLEDLLKKREDMEKRVADSIRGFFKPSGKIGSADEYILGLQQRVDATKKYMADVAALQKRGVSQDIINQILEMGVENGGALAASLATASDAQLAQVADLTTQAESMASTFGTTQANIMYGAGIQSQQALVAGIQAEYDTVIGQINDVVAGIQNALSMLTDSSLVAGEAAAQALLVGLQSREQQILAWVSNLAAQISAMLTAAINNATSGGGSGGSGGSGGGGGGGGGGGHKGGGHKKRSSYEGPSAPTMRSAVAGPAVAVAAGGVQVAVSVGEGQSPAVVEASVRNAVQQALEQVAQQAKNARR